MGADQQIDWRETAASALDWWHDAGVDILVDDAPRDWFAGPALPIGAEVALPAPAPGMPEDLAAFLAWRGSDAVPEAAWRGVSIIASGPADATVMVLVDCPDRDDEQGGILMTGQTGRLFDRMLAAIGLDRTTIHLAAVCAKRPVAGRMPAEVEARLAEIALHHVGLVAPRRLLLMGNAASRAVLGAESTAIRGRLHGLNHKGGQTEVVASFHPRFLIEKPTAKAEAWKDLQMLIGGLSA
ncbi:MAG TPA: uracil-DNA glycosylase [Sphingomonas sp.]|nr:uracil-DNA glycosylase [Sphingomonas sp.]